MLFSDERCVISVVVSSSHGIGCGFHVFLFEV